jgi:TonB-linked SusC/RagA family outer membrane protein
MKKLVSSFFIWCAFSVVALAQERTVTGVVTSSEDALPIPGASVRVKENPNSGVSTGVDGKFSIKITESSKTLLVSSIGFVSQSLAITSGEIKIKLVPDSKQLGEVVVTALGQVRKADGLSYAQQGLKGSSATSTRITDVNTALAGKISNVQVRTQSAAKLGSQSSVKIRGANSVSALGNDPLYVVNGTPVDDINYINMDDVDDIQVLKGPAGTALYGQRGANGVILITSKKAKPNVPAIEFTSSVSFDKVALLPKYQNEYAGGAPNAGWQTYTWKAGDPDEWKALSGKKYHTYNDDQSWGPRIDGSEYIPWYAWLPGTAYSFKTAQLTAQPNNVRDFYATGRNIQNNISFSKATEDFNIRLSYTNQDQTGILPNSGLKRNYISTQFSYTILKNLSLSADINYVNQKLLGDFSDTYTNSASGTFNQFFHRDVDMNILKEFKDYRTPTGASPSWNLNDLSGISSEGIYSGAAYWPNPYAYYDLISVTNIQDRLFGNISAKYDFGSHFTVQAFARRNQRNTHYESKLPYIFERSTKDMASPLANNANGGTRPVSATYRTYDIRQVESNYEFLSTYKQKFGKLNLTANFGGNVRMNSYTYLNNVTRGGLVVEDLFDLKNSKVTPFNFNNDRTKKVVRSLYGNGILSWDDFINLDFSLRNDWSSALPINNNSYLYPSLGLSVLLTKFVSPSLPFVSFAKIRGSWASVGSDLDPYQLQQLYSVGANQYNSNITMTVPNQAIDQNIKPQLSKSAEVGLDLKFLNNRISFSGTYYNENVTNSIINLTVSGASGYNSKLINAGKLNRHGLELSIDGYPVKSKDFSYNLGVNLAFNRSKVIALYPDLDTYYVGGSDYTSATGAAGAAPGVWSVVGGEWGQIRGRGIKKINGQNVINENGSFAFEDNVNFGSVLPKYTGGFVNTFNYKQFNLNFNIDFVNGGKYFSLSDVWGSSTGLYDYTAGLNDKGNPLRDPVENGGGVHVKGVDASGNPVDKYVSALTYFQVNVNNSINETHIFDLSYVKLREVSFGYTFPVAKTSLNKFMKSMQLNVFARNPWLIYAANRNFDPSELTGNYGESGQLPSTRTFGATLKVGF